MSSPPKDPTKTNETEEKAQAKESRKRKQSDLEHSNDSNDDELPTNAKGDGKNWKRIMANRKSARESRIRRIKYMETLETSVEELTRENTALLRENQILARENFALRQQHGMGGGGGNFGLMDASTGRDEASYRQAGLPMGARAGQGLLPYEGAARFPGVSMSPSRTSIPASRSALTRPVLDMPHHGLDMPMESSGFRSATQSMPSSLPRPTVADQYGTLEMIRNRRTQNSIPNPMPSEEEQRLLNLMRRGSKEKK
jgi:hypothetical protein